LAIDSPENNRNAKIVSPPRASEVDR
jgi:hypothetical protein